MDKFYTVEKCESSRWGSNFDTYEEAEAQARKNAYTAGEDYFVMAPVATAKAPLEVNSVKVEKVSA